MNLFDREIFYSIRDKITVRVCNRLLVIECDCVLLLMLSIRRYFFIRKGDWYINVGTCAAGNGGNGTNSNRSATKGVTAEFSHSPCSNPIWSSCFDVVFNYHCKWERANYCELFCVFLLIFIVIFFFINVSSKFIVVVKFFLFEILRNTNNDECWLCWKWNFDRYSIVILLDC